VLLNRLDFEGYGVNEGGENPLLNSRDESRKSMFKKLNLVGNRQGSGSRGKRSGHVARGNSFAGNAFGQRVVIKINPVKNKTKGVGAGAGSGAANLYHHVRYISRSGAGEEGEKAVLFDRENEGLDGKDFFELCKDDRHHFRMIISPENGSEIGDFRGYVRDYMERVEGDLDTKIEWVGAVHYDTDDVHAHVIMRGVNDRGADLVIGRDYISSGLRLRAQEIATDLLGERSLDEIQKSMEKEVDKMAVTSLDRFIEKQVDDERKIDVRKENNFGKNAHYEGLIKGRLRYLEEAGLAKEDPPGVFALGADYHDVLYKISTKNDVIQKLRPQMGVEAEGLNVYSILAGEGQQIEGRVLRKGGVDELTDRKYLVVEDMDRGLHYVPVGENYKFDMVDAGSLIRVRPGEKSSGKADYNINMIATANGGVYSVDQHLIHVAAEQGYIDEADRQGYVDAHVKRLETLEQNDIVESLGSGEFKVPADVVAKGAAVTKEINEREKKRFYPFVDVLSEQPLDKITKAEKKTWLDKELYKQSIGKAGLEKYDEEVLSAIDARKDWLVSKDLGVIQSNGEFSLRKGSLYKLDSMEVLKVGEHLANERNVTFSRQKVKEGEPYLYVGQTKLESGHWAVVTKTGKELQMAYLSKKPDFKQRDKIEFKAIGNKQFEVKAFDKQKFEELQRQQRQQARARDLDKDQELER
jgi:type IV secretory pathway VirD2 relaxase